MGEIPEEEIKFLEYCIKDIEDKVRWGKKEEWTNYHFTQLSEMINNDTGVSLSVSSIRRIFGQDKSYKEKFNPQIETKNTLARFIGYESWADYKTKRNTKTLSPPRFIVKPLMYILILGLLGIGIYFSINYIKQLTTNEVFYFDGRHLYGSPPHTVAFHYDITKMQGDNYYIDFGEYFHPPHEVYLPKNEHIITHTYYNSYYYRVLLKKGDEVIAQDHVMVKSDGWDYGAMVEDNYITLPDNLLKGLDFLYLSPSTLTHYGVDTTKVYNTEYKYVRDFDVSCDNFSFETQMKITKIPVWRGCYKANIWFLGSKDDLMITFTNDGCSGFSSINFSDYEKEGKHDDLTSLGQDLFNWRKVKFSVKNKHTKIFFDDKLIYEFSFQDNVGTLKCIHIHFLGSGAVDNPKLTDGEGQLVFMHDFDTDSASIN